MDLKAHTDGRLPLDLRNVLAVDFSSCTSAPFFNLRSKRMATSQALLSLGSSSEHRGNCLISGIGRLVLRKACRAYAV